MKSWLTYFLPNDEYKEKQMLVFIAEGAILQIFIVILMLIASNFLTFIQADTILLVSSMIFLLYVTARFILSGMEYADITTERAYKKELRAILIKTSVFVSFTLFILGLITIFNVSVLLTNDQNWFAFLVLIICTSFFMCSANYISLKRSFRKNKELL
ncbi:hypothetical protein CEQ21_21615 [Niallia circulans]|uniref:DUF3278 domain-containing protein n=1 Tax=Niallia circulans TaxID=1397 RepID=A0A553SLZ6_NIACI|nr:hypothetical protein [Niallia circulans]TRZ38013.1 hypothetical protein CEQ21_21615 [Niallia circulans]